MKKNNDHWHGLLKRLTNGITHKLKKKNWGVRNSMNRKEVIYLIIVLIILIGLTGCSTGTKKVGWVGSSYPGHWSASFRSFSGTETRKINLSKGELFVISYESEIKKGTFEILISDPDKLEVTNININEKGVKEIIASESGQFRIILKADEAKGKFLFEW